MIPHLIYFIPFLNKQPWVIFLKDFIASQNRPKSTYVARLIQGHETTAFKAKFDSWPSGSAPSAPEEGRGRVAGRY